MSQERKREESRVVGVVVERRPAASRWADWIWRPTEVLDGAARVEPWTVIGEEGEVRRYFAGATELVIHRKETEAYKVNLAADPVLYVVLREVDEGSAPFSLHEVTASPYDAQDETDSGDGIVERVPMPGPIATWIADFCRAHPEEEPFRKRRRDKAKVEEMFSKEPIFARSPRRNADG